jgi:hypothetical protein
MGLEILRICPTKILPLIIQCIKSYKQIETQKITKRMVYLELKIQKVIFKF